MAVQFRVWIHVERHDEDDSGTDEYQNVGWPLEGSEWIDSGAGEDAAQELAEGIATQLHRFAAVLAGQELCVASQCQCSGRVANHG